MDTAEAPKEKQNSSLFIIGLVLLAVGAAVLSSMPAVQNKVSHLFGSSDRQILSKISSFYGIKQTEYVVLKIHDADGIKIEIYEVLPGTSQQIFKQKFELAKDTDAFITLDKNTTNLALSDVDKDGQLDILAPTVDQNGNLRLNAFRYNQDLGIFETLVDTAK